MPRMTKDEIYITQCFTLAKKGANQVFPNPMVGSLITYQNKIIGQGYHKKYGEAHAEVNAFNSVKKEHLHLLHKSTIYISLEPCCHFGKTPPCVDLILKHQIPKVILSVKDPNPLVAGKGIQKLRAHKVEVITGVLEKQGKKLLGNFMEQFTPPQNQ